MDEVVGQMIPFALIDNSSWVFALCSFTLFRIFDISKFGIVGWTERYFDQRQETWALGIMLDDVVAGVCAAILIAIFQSINLIP
jgi:phosphatidylglycerophosphatase A